MKKILGVFILILLLVYGCAQYDSGKEPSLGVPAEKNERLNENVVGAEDANPEVVIEEFAFKPETVTIRKGDTVTWIQKDSVKHTVTSDDGLFESPLLAKGHSWSYRFTETGTFSYHCSPILL